MKQVNIIIAYNTLELLADNETLKNNKSVQWDLYKLRKELRPHFEFQKEQEDIVREKFIKFAAEDGSLPNDKAQEFIKELNDIGNLDIEVDIQKIKVPMVEGITFKLIEPLEEFIEFTPE